MATYSRMLAGLVTAILIAGTATTTLATDAYQRFTDGTTSAFDWGRDLFSRTITFIVTLPADLSAEASLACDRIKHELHLDAAEPLTSPFKAFMERVRSHAFFAGDGFGFGRADARA